MVGCIDAKSYQNNIIWKKSLINSQPNPPLSFTNETFLPGKPFHESGSHFFVKFLQNTFTPIFKENQLFLGRGLVNKKSFARNIRIRLLQ